MQIGAITYSFRSMPDQSAEATVRGGSDLAEGVAHVRLDGGVKILSPNMSDEEFEYVFNVAEALACTHTTLGCPLMRRSSSASATSR